MSNFFSALVWRTEHLRFVVCCRGFEHFEGAREGSGWKCSHVLFDVGVCSYAQLAQEPSK